MYETHCIEITTAHKRRQVQWDQIVYIVSQDRKSNLHLTDGETVCTNVSIRKIAQMLPQDAFLTINKGVLISLRHLRDVQDLDCCMSDGTVLRARVKTSNQLRWNMRLYTMENRYRTQNDLYDAIRSAQAFAMFDLCEDDVRFLFAGEGWQKRFGTQSAHHAFGGDAHEALCCIRETLKDGQVRFFQAEQMSACFFRVDQRTCVCVMHEA